MSGIATMTMLCHCVLLLFVPNLFVLGTSVWPCVMTVSLPGLLILYFCLTKTLPVPNFRHLSYALFFFKQTIDWKEVLYVKLKDWMSNSVDPDETAHYEPSHLDLRYLQMPVLSPLEVKDLKLLNKLFQIRI